MSMPARVMGIPAVPKHQHLAGAAVPLVQFVPPAPIDPTYPQKMLHLTLKRIRCIMWHTMLNISQRDAPPTGDHSA